MKRRWVWWLCLMVGLVGAPPVAAVAAGKARIVSAQRPVKARVGKQRVRLERCTPKKGVVVEAVGPTWVTFHIRRIGRTPDAVSGPYRVTLSSIALGESENSLTAAPDPSARVPGKRAQRLSEERSIQVRVGEGTHRIEVTTDVSLVLRVAAAARERPAWGASPWVAPEPPSDGIALAPLGELPLAPLAQPDVDAFVAPEEAFVDTPPIPGTVALAPDAQTAPAPSLSASDPPAARAPPPAPPRETPARTRIDIAKTWVFARPTAGVFVPFDSQRPGPEIGVTVGADLGVSVAGRLELHLDLAWLRTTTSGPSLIPGRGLDNGFTQQSQAVPAGLILAWYPAVHERIRPYVNLGAGVMWDQTRFTAFSATSSARALGWQALAGLGLEVPAGPGRIAVEALARMSQVDLGVLGRVGSDSLSGVRICAAYRFDL